MANAPVLTFLGGAGTVTGSRFLVESDGARVLVDCGLFQGPKELRLRNWAPFPVDPASLHAVVLTHAHLDHCGYLPALVRDGFRGPVFCTRFTRELAGIVMADSGRLHEEEAAYANRKRYSKHRPALALYTEADARRAEHRLRGVAFGDAVEAAAGVRVEFLPAGHILGAASVLVTLEGAGGRTVWFTGDVGRPSHPLLTAPAPPPDADIVVTESTYGNRRHTSEAEGVEQLAAVVCRTAKRGGTVVVPAFAVDRTEVILMALRGLAAAGRIPRLPVYVDSPMALAVLDVYRKAIAEDDPQIRTDVERDPFELDGEVHEALDPDASRALNDLPYPSVIVSASGMATGGRVLHHLARRLPDPRNAVLLAGFQADGTRGRLLAEGARSLKLHGKYIPVRAEVVQSGAFSVHADADELVSWLGGRRRRPDAAFVVHGEPAASDALQARLADELGWTAVAPRMGERVRVD